MPFDFFVEFALKSQAIAAAPASPDFPAYLHGVESKVTSLADWTENLTDNALVDDYFLGQAGADSRESAPIVKTSAESRPIDSARMADLAGSIVHKSPPRNDNARDSMVAATVGAGDDVLVVLDPQHPLARNIQLLNHADAALTDAENSDGAPFVGANRTACDSVNSAQHLGRLYRLHFRLDG